MISDEQLASIIQQLVSNSCTTVSFEGLNVQLSFKNDGQLIHLITSVYQGDHYIPQSVRRALQQQPVGLSNRFMSSMQIDEENFRILLSCQSAWEEEHGRLKDLFYEFTWVAEEWKEWLNEKGKEDLLPIYIKK